MSKIRVRSDATEKLCSSCNVGSRLRTFRRVERASKRHQKMACIATAATATLGGIDGDIQLHGYTRSDEEDGVIILQRPPRQAKGRSYDDTNHENDADGSFSRGAGIFCCFVSDCIAPAGGW